MEFTMDTDYFKLLEDKIGELIARVQEMKNEKESYLQTIEEQKSKIESMSSELYSLKETNNQAKERISNIIEKIDQLAV